MGGATLKQEHVLRCRSGAAVADGGVAAKSCLCESQRHSTLKLSHAARCLHALDCRAVRRGCCEDRSGPELKRVASTTNDQSISDLSHPAR